MNFVVNTKEPRKSEIAQKLNPVYWDKGKHHFIQLNAPNRNLQRSYPEENGCYLESLINGILV